MDDQFKKDLIELLNEQFERKFIRLFNQSFEALVLPEFERLNNRMGKLETSMDSLETRIDHMDRKLDIISAKNLERDSQLKNYGRRIKKLGSLKLAA